MDQQQYRQYINAVLRKCFSMMSDPERLYVFQQASIGDILISGGFIWTLLPRFNKKSATLIINERYRSLDVRFDGVDEFKYLPHWEYGIFSNYVNTTKKFFTDRYFWSFMRSNVPDNALFMNLIRCNTYDLSPDTPYHAPIVNDISDDAKTRLHRDYTLDKARTVILTPNTSSGLSINLNFWFTLIGNLRRAGFVVYCNVGKNAASITDTPLPGTFPMQVGLNEIFYLASRVKCVVGVRSGLLDLLAFSSATVFCISPSSLYKFDLKLNFPQSPATIRTFYFDFDLFSKFQALVSKHELGSIRIDNVKHKSISDSSMFWSENDLLAAILRAVDAK